VGVAYHSAPLIDASGGVIEGRAPWIKEGPVGACCCLTLADSSEQEDYGGDRIPERHSAPLSPTEMLPRIDAVAGTTLEMQQREYGRLLAPDRGLRPQNKGEGREQDKSVRKPPHLSITAHDFVEL
jgi:hypothetical protein